AAGDSSTYGIRLEGLRVVDVDSDTPEARVYVENYIGHSPYRVKTSRGYHLWFRHKGEKPQNVRNAFIAIDFKTGGNQQVVGPRSIRPDKVVYQAIADLPHPSEL